MALLDPVAALVPLVERAAGAARVEVLDELEERVVGHDLFGQIATGSGDDAGHLRSARGRKKGA